MEKLKAESEKKFENPEIARLREPMEKLIGQMRK